MDAGRGGCKCYWNCGSDSYCGDCLIDRECDGDRLGWRITEYEVKTQ